MLTFKQFILEGTKIVWNDDLENEIVKTHVQGIQKAQKTGGNWGIHDLADAVGINHQTLRRHILIPRKWNQITGRLNIDEPLRRKKPTGKSRPEVASKTALNAAADSIRSGETSLRRVHERFPSAKPSHVRQAVKEILARKR